MTQLATVIPFHRPYRVGDRVLFSDGSIGSITTELGALHANRNPRAHGIVQRLPAVPSRTEVKRGQQS
jgi:hypothetical protein